MSDLVDPVKIIVKCFIVIFLVLAFLLLVWPDLFVKLNRFCKKWFSTARFEKELNRTRDIDAQLLNMRKVLGFIAAALVLIFALMLLR